MRKSRVENHFTRRINRTLALTSQQQQTFRNRMANCWEQFSNGVSHPRCRMRTYVRGDAFMGRVSRKRLPWGGRVAGVDCCAEQATERIEAEVCTLAGQI